MKCILSVVLCCSAFSINAFADHHGERLAARKANIQAHLDKKIAQLNEHKSCVSSASAKGDIKKCMVSHKEKMKSLKSEMKANRQSFKDKWKSKKKG